jgi:hypothetical protein
MALRALLVIAGCLLATSALSQQVAAPGTKLVDPARADLPPGAILRLGSPRQTDRSFGVYDIAYSRDGQMVATRSLDNVVRVWDASTGSQQHALDGHRGRVRDMCFSSDSRYLLTTSAEVGGSVLIWDLDTGQVAYRLPFSGALVAACPDESHMVVGAGWLVRFEVPSGGSEALESIRLPRQSIPLAISPDASTIVVHVPPLAGSVRGDLLGVLDLRKKKLTEIRGFPTQPLGAATIAEPNHGKIGVVCQGDARVYVCDTEFPESRMTLIGHSGPVQDIACSADGRHLASGSTDGTVRIWELLTGELLTIFDGHGDGVRTVAFSPDGRRLAAGVAGSKENGAYVWEVVERVMVSASQSTTSMNDWWTRLGAVDPIPAYACLAELIQTPEESLRFLESKVNELASSPSLQEIEELVNNLDHPRFQVREAAYEDLVRMRDLVREQLQRALRDRQSVETRFRLMRILQNHAPQMTLDQADRRRVLRLIYALELIGSHRARALLDQLAAGHTDVEVRGNAAAARRRIGDG